ncbi:MAG: EAL domain-containing protein [Spirochaetes bacterium]|nr:EAL domain-containing protein [Spirochaetota bacterium]
MINSLNVYRVLSLLFSGFIIYAFLENLYTYYNIRQEKKLPVLMLNCIAFIYIISDMLFSYFAFYKPVTGTACFFISFKEVSLLLFLIVLPFFLEKILELKSRQKFTNRLVLWAGAVSAVIIGVFMVLFPDSLNICSIQGNPEYVSCQPVITPLSVIRNILFTLYLLYMLAWILFSTVYRKTASPTKNILIGLIVFCYFTVMYMYNIFFNNSHVFQYPHIALGIVLLILFINYSSIDLSAVSIKQLNKVRSDLDYILNYDALIGIPNRMAFVNNLQSGLDNIDLKGGGFSLLFIDIDDFQSLNECFGQTAGKEILKMLSERIKEYFAHAGTLYRIGDDDFVLFVQENKSEEEIKSLAGQIIASLRNPFVIGGVTYTITASLAVLQIPKDGKDTETVFNNGYAGITSAKKIKNTYLLFDNDLTDRISGKIQTVNLLRSCINRDQFTLHYQPIVDSSGKIKHVESLLRCTHPDPSIGGPGVFIPLLVEAGLMTEIDNMVLRKAFHDVEMRIKKRFEISINLSAGQIVDSAYSGFIASFTRQHGIENRSVILEVTESTLIQNMSAGRENLQKLKDSGFRIAIDDFGKGFSSLTYLAELPVDILKMDMVFVHSVPGDPRKEKMVQHIIEMAHSLGLKVTAEGFEQQEQVDFFKGLGCDYFQGYYFSRPLPIDDLLAKYKD